MEFSDNVASLEPSATLALAARARALREEGRSVVDLSAGEPVWDTPRHAAEAGIRAIREGETGYPPTPGIPALRRAAATYLTETTRARIEEDRILVSAGVKQALFNCVFTLFGPGDEVLVPAPFWTSYLPQVRLARAEPVVVRCSWDDRFLPAPDALESARSKRTRGLLLNSPSNPTGEVYPRELLEEISSWAERHGIWVVTDEIYRLLHFGDGPAPSLLDVAELPERSVVLDGVSKAFAMPGWRIGFAAGPRELISEVSDLQSQTTSGASTISQHAAAAALADADLRREVVEGFLERLRRTRAMAVEELRGTPGIEVRPPAGGIFLFVRVQGDAPTDEVAERLLVDAGVGSVPGEAFGGPGHLRFNLAVEPETMREGIRRIRGFFGGEGP